MIFPVLSRCNALCPSEKTRKGGNFGEIQLVGYLRDTQ